ncbi:alpha/beta-hydrolase [Parathielavia appendiculata]|uniref:Alpha/beta-hydrolase n=1 Tax=Parathielavia appendiculata TaxID=2587402 RepID=A0AAN6UA41_9PEZI|nr:alpha/beta-hydrolase [Parathielavia appendiculata]
MTNFGPIHVVEPRAPHTHTIIILHGRGSTGEEFAEELFESKLSTGKTLQEHLGSWRWVFPSSAELWSTVFEEDMPACFGAHSLTDPTARRDLQKAGIRDSVRYLTRLLEAEVDRLGGASGKVVPGGMSQGGAIGLWSLLCAGADGSAGRLGGFVGASTWLPFADELERHLGQEAQAQQDTIRADAREADSDAFVEEMAGATRRTLQEPSASQHGLLSVPVFLGHGTDDVYVNVSLGRRAAVVLGKISLNVEWHEYSGADQEGHWIKEPEELDDIVRFLESMSAA